MPDWLGIELTKPVTQKLISDFACFVSFRMSNQPFLVSSNEYIALVIKRRMGPIPKLIEISVSVMDANCLAWMQFEDAAAPNLRLRQLIFSYGTDM